MKGITNNRNCDGSCSRCGDCCGCVPMPLTKKEAETIVKYVIEHKIKAIKPKEVMGTVELRCCYYDKVNKRCMIYEARPEICRTFNCNMSDKEIVENTVRLHASAFYNGPDQQNMTNFNTLFYGDLHILFMWLYENLSETISNDGERKEFVERLLQEKGCQYMLKGEGEMFYE